MHLAIRTNAATKGPTETILADRLKDDTQVLLRMRAKLGQLRVTQLNVGVELERLADENECDHAIQIEGAT